MRLHEEIFLRLATRRRQKLGDLSEEAFAELMLAVRENPDAFLDDMSEGALQVLERGLNTYAESVRDDDLLEDDQYQKVRLTRLGALRVACAAAYTMDPGCLDARVIDVMAQDLGPDETLAKLVRIRSEADPLPEAGADAWSDVFARPRLRLEAAISRVLLDGARCRAAIATSERIMECMPGDELGCRHTEAIALARLEDEAGFDALDARFGRHDDSWTGLSRVILLYKLGRLSAARRALRGFGDLCPGGLYALLRPVYVEVYLPDRPEATPNTMEEAFLAVREAEPTIADVPGFIPWCCEQPGISEGAKAWAEKNDLDW